jgi:nucleosome binding factor SPN SPT16 subunit
MLQYIILSYFIIKTVVNTTSLLTFYIIIPILNKLNSLFYNNILLNVTLTNSKDNKNKVDTNIETTPTKVEDEVDTEDEDEVDTEDEDEVDTEDEDEVYTEDEEEKEDKVEDKKEEVDDEILVDETLH